jgi:hypothetical protein
MNVRSVKNILLIDLKMIKALTFTLLALSALLYSTVVAEEMLVDPDRIERIKKLATTWTPYEPENHPFRNLTREQGRKRLGIKSIGSSSIFSHLQPKQSSHSKLRGANIHKL